MNVTVDRLYRMSPGEQMIYYRGHLPADIENSKECPRYQELLRNVWSTAKELGKAGRLILSEETVKMTKEVEIRVTNEETGEPSTKMISRTFSIVEYTARSRR